MGLYVAQGCSGMEFAGGREVSAETRIRLYGPSPVQLKQECANCEQ